MKILIVDDHSVLRAGLRQILADEFPAVVTGEAGDGETAIAASQRESWDLVIVDVSIPKRNGLDVLKELKRLHPHLPVLVFSMYPEQQYAVRALRAGASGYLMKSAPPAELIAAVRKALNGGRYVSATLAERLAQEVASSAPTAPHQALSNRELEILRLIAEGKTVKEIAGAVSLSVNTVSTYRGRILTKMRMENNAELMRYAVDHRLFD